MPGTNEWTLTAQIASWIADIARDRPDLPFSEAKVEERRRGSAKRRDLTLYDRHGKAVITGEMKMPDSPEGRTPFQEALVKDAHDKADQIGAQYFFTWNVNRCVLWRTFEQGKPITERDIEHFAVFTSPLRNSEEVAHPRSEERIRNFLTLFLERCAGLWRGDQPLSFMPLDERFLVIWESSLEQPVAQTLREIASRYLKDSKFTVALDKWMRDEQTWTLSHKDDEVIRENLDRAAKLSSYVLANKIIFYKALRRRFANMRAMKIPDTVTTGPELQAALADSFKHAAEVSRDYETVFKGDYGDTLPFLNDAAVDSWRDLVHQTDGFDFTQLDYEVIGQVFERMLSTSERHKFGQHYTRSEVVDLINAFCIRDANAKVMDPACGGGTFLVRAYTRKRDLSGQQLGHQQLLQHLYGIDISAYPAHLTTINLATRDLIDRANYPLVARRDFFKTHVDEPIFHVPLGRGDNQLVTLQLERVDALVGNPPYIRQEKITEYYGKKYKAALRKQADHDAPGAALTGRSDIHCYFFTHGLTFLNDGAYVGLLTSSTWLDTGYGFSLQEFLLDNFEIVAIFESNCEPWFTGARVTTAATILRRQPDAAKRAENKVKFVLLTEPITDLLTYAATEDDRRMTFEALRDRVETMDGKEEFSAYLGGPEPLSVRQERLHGMRVRVVRQGDLYDLGCGGIGITPNDESDDSEASDPAVMSDGSDNPETRGYTGSKWGIFLRAPDVFFKLLQRGGDAFVPLGAPGLANIKRGVTSGCDTFFFPRDITDEALKRFPDRAQFHEQYGITRHATERIRLVRAGDGTIHGIEAEYLEPVIFNLMEIDSVQIDPGKLKKRILSITKPKEDLRGTETLRYVRWGEREGFSERSTCASRERWYDLSTSRGGHLLWTMAQRYRHIVPENPSHLRCNHNLFDVTVQAGVSERILAGVLNSSVVALFKYQFGRLMGGDPMLKTEVVDVKMMLVPDPRRASAEVRQRLETALDSLKQRQIAHLVDIDGEGTEPSGDLAMADRQALDDAVLELIGVSDPLERTALRAELYAEITRMYRTIRSAEKKMQAFRSKAARKGRATPRSIAQEIWDLMEETPVHRTPLDFVPEADTEEIELPEGRARVVSDLWNGYSLLVDGRNIVLRHPLRAEFAKALRDCGLHGPVPIPIDPDIARQALREYDDYVAQTNATFADHAGEHTSEPEMQERVVSELWRLLRKAGAAPDTAPSTASPPFE